LFSPLPSSNLGNIVGGGVAALGHAQVSGKKLNRQRRRTGAEEMRKII
jgi:hypothetical protein